MDKNKLTLHMQILHIISFNAIYNKILIYLGEFFHALELRTRAHIKVCDLILQDANPLYVSQLLINILQ